MSGIKGRSGKLTTAEQKASASERGKKGMATRYGAPPALPPSTAVDPESDDPVERLGQPLTWGDELKRQQVKGEEIQNQRRAVEVQRAEVELAKAQDDRAEARKLLIPRADHIRDIRAIIDAIISDLTPISDAAVNFVPPEQQPRMRHIMDQAIHTFRVAAAERIPT